VYVASQESGTVTGTVVGIDSTVLVQAQVRISGSDRVVLSDGDGRFRIARVTAGEHVLEVHRLGYRAVLQPVTVGAGQTVQMSVVLTPVPVPLKEVEVEAELALLPAMKGFEQRRAQGYGHFFNRREIAQMQPRVFTDVLRRVPGVVIQSTPGPFGPTEQIRMGRTTGIGGGGRACPVLFYLNGTPFPVTGDVSIDQYIAPEDVIAVEVYNGASQIPSQFQANLLNARCGVIAIWTRVGNERDRASDPPKK